MRVLVLFVALALGGGYCTSSIAKAEEQPCVYTDERTRVSCTLDGFKKLTSAVVNAESEAKEANIRLTAAEQGRVEASDALKRCIASIPPPRSPLKSRAAFVLSSLGASAATVAVLSNGDATNRFGYAAGGLVSLLAGYWLLSSD